MDGWYYMYFLEVTIIKCDRILVESDYFADGWSVFALCEWISGWFRYIVREVIVAGCWSGWELCSELR